MAVLLVAAALVLSNAGSAAASQIWVNNGPKHTGPLR